MQNQPKCLYCATTDAEQPLVNLSFQGQPLWICPQHLPLLIHEPAKLTEALKTVGNSTKTD